MFIGFGWPDPVAGDTLQWRLAMGSFAVQGVPRKHVFIKPTRAGLGTNLTPNTNRRTYFLELESLESNPMVTVQWHYPSEDARAVALPPTGQAKPRNAARAVAPGDAATIHWDYAIKVVERHPPWKASVVFDDGAKTYIRFLHFRLGEHMFQFALASSGNPRASSLSLVAGNLVAFVPSLQLIGWSWRHPCKNLR